MNKYEQLVNEFNKTRRENEILFLKKRKLEKENLNLKKELRLLNNKMKMLNKIIKKIDK